MKRVDIVFPLNLRPLTYEVPEALAGMVRPGMMVEAEVKRSIQRGIVLGKSTLEGAKRLKPVKSVVDVPPLSEAMLKMIAWVSEYYFASEGLALKGMIPEEYFKISKVEPSPAPADIKRAKKAREDLAGVRDHALRGEYRTFLYHAPSTRREIELVIEAAAGLAGVIIIVPDQAEAKRIEGMIGGALGERLCVYHGGLTGKKRRLALESILSGRADIVLGSRSAVFAPLRKVSLIAVLGEESALYKSEGGVRTSARDAAVMRGYLEGGAVLLSSICPSVESVHNAQIGKYGVVTDSAAARRPMVRVIDTYKTRTAVSARLKKAVGDTLKGGGRALVYSNRRGHSIIRCEECGHTESCPDCAIPLVYHREGRRLACHYCGREGRVPGSCGKCGGSVLSATGTGVERAEQELEPFHPVGVDSKRKAGLRLITEEAGGLAVGTKILTRRTELSGAFALAGILGADGYRYMADFRAAERAFQDFCHVADMVSPDGQVILQSRHPEAALVRQMRRFDFRGFYRNELEQRRELSYPPFARLALITVEEGPKPAAGSYPDCEVLGPVRGISRRGKHVWKILLKAATRRHLGPALEGITSSLSGRRFSVDVDPAVL